jgi:hypothetical protein
LAKLNKGPVLYDQCFAMPLDLLDLDLDDYIDDNNIHTTPWFILKLAAESIDGEFAL